MDYDKPKKKRGGARPGAGRPKGKGNALEYGEGKALKAAGLRVPEKAPPAHRELADEALGRIVDVMRGDVSYMEASAVLKAATHIRSEICGPVAQKVETTGANGGAIVVEILREGGE